MSALLAAAGSALWLGILTSISPCPLASNVAAISYIGREVGSPRRALWAGVLYSLGRAAAYVLVGTLVVTSLLSVPGLSFFLQERMNQILGPLLVLVGVSMTGWLRFPGSRRLGGGAALPAQRLVSRGVAGAAVLGMIFALSFCPVSAGLFFGGLIPLAVSADSRILLPAIYGLGTGLPVAFFALLLVLAARWTGRAFDILARIERGARPVTALVFVLAGVYLVMTHILRIGS